MIAGLYQRDSMQMTSSKRILLKEIIKGEASRNSAIKVRNDILELLKDINTIEIDLSGANLTPSVADELIGGLALHFGANGFKKKINVINASESQVALMKHVIARRLSRIPK
jgi:hypothetical protein